MAPEPRRDWPKGFNQDKIRSAAGLLLLFPIDGEAHIVLTLRSDALGRHGGQVSLPGGVTEPGETFETAALREAHEEVALSTAEVTVPRGVDPNRHSSERFSASSDRRVDDDQADARPV